MRVYSEGTEAIEAAQGETFVIALAGNPTTGFVWEPEFDTRRLKLLSREFQPQGARIGAGGEERFQFQALGSGETEVRFELRRAWEPQARERKRFRIAILGERQS